MNTPTPEQLPQTAWDLVEAEHLVNAEREAENENWRTD